MVSTKHGVFIPRAHYSCYSCSIAPAGVRGCNDRKGYEGTRGAHSEGRCSEPEGMPNCSTECLYCAMDTLTLNYRCICSIKRASLA